MSKRVYEIARELDLDTKEVIGQLNDAGVEVKSHFAIVDDPLYERVFGQGSEGAASNDHLEGQEAEGLESRMRSLWERSLSDRVLLYILVVILAFAVAAGVGAIAALIMQTI
jgi:hypothetical protein